MATEPIVFALSNPDPEVNPVEAAKVAKVVATGRSDYPNQINNVLAFPGIFRGLLDSGAVKITQEVLVASAEAIANCVAPDALSPVYIVPSVFDTSVAPAVAEAVIGATGNPRSSER
jgi:malate dehydrogenase (oxaloacetate-decarboxylating)